MFAVKIRRGYTVIDVLKFAHRDEHEGDGVNDTKRIAKFISCVICRKRVDAAFQDGDEILGEMSAEKESDEDWSAK